MEVFQESHGQRVSLPVEGIDAAWYVSAAYRAQLSAAHCQLGAEVRRTDENSWAIVLLLFGG